MGIRVYKPTSAARRFTSVLTFEELTKKAPEKSLLAPIKNHAGRNFSGKISVRHQGGGNRRKYRIIDFKRNKDNIPARVAAIEYDPNRTANIALLHLPRWRKALHHRSPGPEGRRYHRLRR